ncbi:reverse transcriptase domain-containing protein [Tanacetum coccineum]
MGPFPSSKATKYILVGVDYLSKWVERKELPTNETDVGKFLKSLFSTDSGALCAIIRIAEPHSALDQFTKVMLKYWESLIRLSTSVSSTFNVDYVEDTDFKKKEQKEKAKVKPNPSTVVERAKLK